MLQTIRDKAQGWIAWVIVGLIILTFALFGIDQYARGDKVVVVAQVNGEDITARDFLMLYNRQKSRLEKQFGDMYDQVVKDSELRDQVLDALIESEVIRQWSNDNDMIISDPQLAATIHAADVFQQDGKFSQKVYEEILMRNGMNVARFEYEQRQFLLENQYRSLSLGSSFATESEIEQLAQLQAQQRNVNYLRIDQRPFLKTVEVTSDQVADYYDKNKSAYVEPEKVVVQYVELSKEELAKKIPVNDKVLKAYYEDNKLLFTLPEKRHAKHILISVEGDSKEADEKAKKTIAEVQAKLKAGESFEELAKTYSQDPGSAQSGGDLGSFEQGMMVPAFDEAVFSMKVGEISQPVKTDFGYHLIKLDGIEPKKIEAFADVKDQVTKQYQLQEAEKQYFDILEKLNTIAYEQSDSLDPAAEATGLEVKTSKPFSREGGASAVTSNGKVINAAFSDDVLKSRLNSSSIELSPNHSVVIRVKDYFEAHQKSLDEVEASIKENLVRKAAIAEAAKLAKDLFAKVEAGENPESLMRDGIEWNTVGWIDRNNRRILPQMTAEAFKANKPQSDKPTWRSYQLTTGDTVLIQVTGVKNGEVTDDQKAQLSKAVTDLMGSTEVQGRLKAILAKAEIVKKQNYKTLK
ncbi:SurA N-terminal domain-containing protein [Thiomicrorhabdus sp. ZW0627]|uniref:SurA N-terminal domain-containing protein n=1 Tax=Thiomicrorhabdus sp. ZW0627 TaxID=3039774 RepID=UPI0024366989|nr:SurA N-terminal domain-containing protein [Thiomicrorhabdus sp. ZW0627]MDG6773118.1 SurA N-terminal domain-containing protein [Thiomicrorhabdus sp. ZW0627]